MPSSTSVVLTVRGVDATRAVFRRVRANVALMAARVRALTTSAAATTATLAVATTGLAAATVAAAKSFGKLSDRAAQAGTTASDLDKLAHALSQAGVKNANVDAIADAFGRMAKATGRTGYEGFRETLLQISTIGDEGRRIAELSRVFGRAFGPGLAAAVRSGPNQLRKSLDGIMKLLPGLNNQVVAAGDAIADGFETAKRGVVQSIQTMLVGAADKAFKHFGVSARGAGVIVAGYAKVYGEIFLANLGAIWDRIVITWKNLPDIVGDVFTVLKAKFADLVVDIGNKLGLVLAAVSAIMLAVGNLPGAAILGAADIALALGIAKVEEAGEAAKNEVADAEKRLREYYANARKFDWKPSPEQQEYLDSLKAQVKEYDKLLEGLGGGAAADLGGALGPMRDAAAVLSNSYQAFRIASQRGLGGSNGGLSAERAAQSTAQNTAAIERNSVEQTRLLRRQTSMLESAAPLGVIA